LVLAALVQPRSHRTQMGRMITSGVK